MKISTKACEYIDDLAQSARGKLRGLSKKTSLSFEDAVKYVEFFGGTVEPRSNEPSQFVKDEDSSSFCIFVKERNPEEVIHELGHALLNWDDSSNCFNVGIDDHKEQAANYFMRCFLMPSAIFIHEVFKNTYNNICDFKALSDAFNVSKYTVVARGNDLGIWMG